MAAWERGHLEYRARVAALRRSKFAREIDLFPLVRYVRPPLPEQCLCGFSSFDGFIAATDDPVWDWFTPPNNIGCNCKLEQLSLARLDRKGWSVSAAYPDRCSITLGFDVDWAVKSAEDAMQPERPD